MPVTMGQVTMAACSSSTRRECKGNKAGDRVIWMFGIVAQ